MRLKSVFLDGLRGSIDDAPRSTPALRSMCTASVMRDTLARSRSNRETNRLCGDGG
jgi:hypothetical protein